MDGFGWTLYLMDGLDDFFTTKKIVDFNRQMDFFIHLLESKSISIQSIHFASPTVNSEHDKMNDPSGEGVGYNQK